MLLTRHVWSLSFPYLALAGLILFTLGPLALLPPTPRGGEESAPPDTLGLMLTRAQTETETRFPLPRLVMGEAESALTEADQALLQRYRLGHVAIEKDCRGTLGDPDGAEACLKANLDQLGSLFQGWEARGQAGDTPEARLRRLQECDAAHGLLAETVTCFLP